MKDNAENESFLFVLTFLAKGKIIETYQLSVNAIFELLCEVRADLSQVTRRSLAVSSMEKLLVTLDFLLHYPW